MHVFGQSGLLGFLLAFLAGVNSAAGQTPSTAQDVAKRLALAFERHDFASVTTDLTAASREQFLGLLDLSDQVDKASRDYAELMKLRFGVPQPPIASPLRTALQHVTRVEVAGEKSVNDSTVEFDIKVSAKIGDRVKQATVKWTAVSDGNSWRIELPGCSNPADLAPIKYRYQTEITALNQTVAEIKSRQISRSMEAQIALRKKLTVKAAR